MPTPTLKQVIGEASEVGEPCMNIQELYDGISGSLWKSVSKESYNVRKPVLKEEVI